MSEEIRNDAMESAKNHKKSWLKLGKSLFEIYLNDSFEDWGYTKFKDYIEEELGITVMTAKQMITAYEFIKNNKPSVLNTIDESDTYIPSFRTLVDLDKVEDENKKKEYTDKVFDHQENEKQTSKEIKDLIKKDVDPLEEIKAHNKKIVNKTKAIIKLVIDEKANINQDTIDLIYKFKEEMEKQI